MSRSPLAKAVDGRIPGWLSVARLGDIGLAMIWAFFAAASSTATVRDAPTETWWATAHHAASSVVLCLFAFLFIVRRPATSRADGWVSKLVAIIGSWLMPVLIWLPLNWTADWLLAATTLGLTATYLVVIWSLLTLRRSFSIFPEARALVRRGPYSLVRHPLYATYMAMYAMLLLPRLSLAAVAVTMLAIGCEIWRAHDEERVLRAAFPDYDDYAAVTPRFVPRLSLRPRRPASTAVQPISRTESSLGSARRAS